ncbi:MAG: six-hairpin glycosidase [Bacteroidetes bacterium GWF2_40_14]|nr:MAG: six-hairpin glycosidase [Bacteroidetes bacterium GWF2_40_14]
MRPFIKVILCTLPILIIAAFTSAPKEISFADIKEVSFTKVHFTDNFWAPRIEINRTVSIPSAFHQCEINGRFNNFAIAGGLIKGEHKGDFPFDDTDPYKIIEGASYSLVAHYDPKLDRYLDSVIVLIAAAQEPDGYLTTCVTNKVERLSRWWGSKRWEKINSHELYNCGHLYEAAVAHYKATGKHTLLDVALKNANLVCKVFGLGEGQIKYPSGHPIIEMALIKLFQVSGEIKYLDEARYFVDEAGRLSNGRKPGIYSQDHKPVLEQNEIVGHAVRAGYFYSGVADVAMVQRDKKLFEAVTRVWDNMAGRKLYLNGGTGSRPHGEGFGPDYELNNFNNYCETCASIANVYWNHRMFLATGDSKYYDVLERTLYNGLVAGVSLSGDRFFYDNPMASPGGHDRQKWFGCACCPGNVTRFMASVPLYNYATIKDDIYVNLYVSGNAEIVTESGLVNLVQETCYPWNGNVKIKIDPVRGDNKFSLLLRIPGWVQNKPVPTDLYHYADNEKPKVTLSVNGKHHKIKTHNGYAVINRSWKAGDVVSLCMDMPVRRVQAHLAVNYDKGLMAIERGPILYAMEGCDQDHPFVFDIVVPEGTNFSNKFEKDILGGVITLEGKGFAVEFDAQSKKTVNRPLNFKAIPYCTWNNRGVFSMVTWLPTSADYAIIKSVPTIASNAIQVGGWGFNDQFEPKSSSDINTPYHYWWLKSGTEESVAYKFLKPETVSTVEIYWLAFDHYDVIYKAPESWKLLYKDGEKWKEVNNPSGYGTDLNKYNKLTFDPVTTTELKVVAQLRRSGASAKVDETAPQVIDVGRQGFSGGVIEWKVY